MWTSSTFYNFGIPLHIHICWRPATFTSFLARSLACMRACVLQLVEDQFCIAAYVCSMYLLLHVCIHSVYFFYPSLLYYLAHLVYNVYYYVEASSFILLITQLYFLLLSFLCQTGWAGLALFFARFGSKKKRFHLRASFELGRQKPVSAT